MDKRYAGNNLSCTTCHLDGGTRKFGNPLVGTFVTYPHFLSTGLPVGVKLDGGGTLKL